MALARFLCRERSSDIDHDAGGQVGQAEIADRSCFHVTGRPAPEER